jgi:hypothetical protein
MLWHDHYILSKDLQFFIYQQLLVLLYCLRDIVEISSDALKAHTDICILFYLLVSLILIEVDQF